MTAPDLKKTPYIQNSAARDVNHVSVDSVGRIYELIVYKYRLIEPSCSSSRRKVVKLGDLVRPYTRVGNSTKIFGHDLTWSSAGPP